MLRNILFSIFLFALSSQIQAMHGIKNYKPIRKKMHAMPRKTRACLLGQKYANMFMRDVHTGRQEKNDQSPETKIITLSFNPRLSPLIHGHKFRTFNSISEACCAYKIKQQYSGDDWKSETSDVKALYALQTEVDNDRNNYPAKLLLKESIGSYIKLVESWSEAALLYPSYDYKIRETGEGDFTIAEEFTDFMKKATALGFFKIPNNRFEESYCELKKQDAPKFFETLNKLLKNANIILDKGVTYALTENTTSRYVPTSKYSGRVSINFYDSQQLSNDELMCLVAHELSHSCLHHFIYPNPNISLWYGSSQHMRDIIGRVYEREADTMGLNITKKPYAQVTRFIKRSIGRIDFIYETHPTTFERICYALYQNELLDKLELGRSKWSKTSN